ncbi:hypothetical protein C1H46_018746 [Malus baccata]|uniref:Uncharacterized protein n=1 Tax=Malus baccata TaxID=106549 RepID=A0A540MA91_MALBA|nr:hypothetical protein C1H46_018746 [Malus baccata]
MGSQGAFDLRHNHRVDGARPPSSGLGGKAGRAPCGLQRREGREKEGNGWVCGEDGCMEERRGRRRKGVGMAGTQEFSLDFYHTSNPSDSPLQPH